MAKLPFLGRGFGKRHSQDVMGPHMSCAIDTKGIEENAEVKMVLSHPESVSRPKEMEVMSSPTENAEVKEESSTTIATAEESGEVGSNKVRWLPPSSEDESEMEEKDSAGGVKNIGQVLKLPLEGVNLIDMEEKKNYAMLPQIQQAIDIMLSNAASTPPATKAEGVADMTHTDPAPPLSEVESSRVEGGAQGLGVGEGAILKNSVEPKEMVGMDR